MCFFCPAFVMPLCASVYLCLVVTCWGRADLLLSFVVSYCEFITFLLVSWVRYGTYLYRFLIFAPILTLLVSIAKQAGLNIILREIQKTGFLKSQPIWNPCNMYRLPTPLYEQIKTRTVTFISKHLFRKGKNV